MNHITELERGRESYARGGWLEAYESLSGADRMTSLGPDDLELLARSAYMLGRDEEYVSGLERALEAHLGAGKARPAARCAFWIAHSMLFRGQSTRAQGWFGRAQRLLDDEAADCVERGYLLAPAWLAQMSAGDWENGYATAAAAVAIGERFGDADLVWLARDDQARALLKLGRVEEGLRLVDEALVVADSRRLSPIVTGILYCNTIVFCRDGYELGHVREWTEALTRWCEHQPEMVAHNGLCLVHRAEIMQLCGAWAGALNEAVRAAERFTQGALNERARGKAYYRQGEIRRLRGELGAAESAYREASRYGCDPQPGLALLRLQQGNGAAAAGAIRRAVGETVQPLQRAALLPAYVEIMLSVGDVEAAATASGQLGEIADRQGAEALGALSAQAAGAVALARGNAARALSELRRAWTVWLELDAPYDAACSRVLLGLACRALGDEDTAALELEAARSVFGKLGAAPDLARLESLAGREASAEAHGLTRRELEVLRLVARGSSNREIAEALVISEHTVARHVQNILAKLGVGSRTAAGAYAFEHEFV